MKQLLSSALGTLALTLALPSGAIAQTDNVYLGDVVMIGFSFCPRGFAEADGRTLPLMQHENLFSILGSIYGGNARTTMALPDFRGRVPVGHGQAPNMAAYTQGDYGGEESVVLTVNNLPPHSHSLLATNVGNNSVSPNGTAFTTLTGPSEVAYNTGVNIAFESDVISRTGSGQPVSVMSASTVVQYCIATQGTYPPRG